MMDELISRQDAVDILLQHPFEKVVNCISILEELPSVQPRKGKWHGKGDSEGFGIFICDNCGKFAMMEYDFCPNCGCCMEEGDAE